MEEVVLLLVLLLVLLTSSPSCRPVGGGEGVREAVQEADGGAPSGVRDP